MGPVTRNVWVMVGTMFLAVTLWVCGAKLGIPSVVAATIGLSILLLLGVLGWNDCLSEKSAWDTLAWFAVSVGMAGQLTNLGIVSWMSGCVAKFPPIFFLELVGCIRCSSGILLFLSTTYFQVKPVV